MSAVRKVQTSLGCLWHIPEEPIGLQKVRLLESSRRAQRMPEMTRLTQRGHQALGGYGRKINRCSGARE
jgi:hypothetical protein